MVNAINFDMEGTLADFYGVDNWLQYLIERNPFPYEVRARLLKLALYNDYGRTELHPFAPMYKSSTVVGGEMEVEFEVYGSSLYDGGAALTEFELAGEDKVFYPAQAHVTGSATVRVSSASVPAPVAVRYCFKDWSEGNLRSVDGLPAAPFRSDNW